MMNEIDERIIRYYDQEMSAAEVEQFMQEITTDAQLKQEFEFYGTVIEGIRDEGAIELKEYIKEHLQTDELSSQSNLWMYAAASVTLLLLSYFAIYSYLETGNIQEAAEIITLKDEKSDKFKFWKRNKNKTAIQNLDTTSIYKDSLLALEQKRNSDSSVLLAMEIVEEDDDKITENYSAEMAPAPENPLPRAILITQVSVIPIKLMSTEVVAESSLDMGTQTRQMNKVQGVQMGKERNKADELQVNGAERLKSKSTTAVTTKKTSDSYPATAEFEKKTDTAQLKKSIAMPKSKPTRFKLMHFEDEKGKPHAIVTKSGNEMIVSIYNIWGENPLVFEINQEFYLDLGTSENNTAKEPSRIWKLPISSGNYENIDWVTNKRIIEQIRN